MSFHDNIQRRAKCGTRNNRIDVRPNWKEAPGSVDDWSANLHGEPDVLSAEAKLAALVTLGSPLTHAEFLLANGKEDLGKRKTGREFPTSPPVREDLDDSLLQQAQAAGLPVKPDRPQLFSFALGPDGRYWQLHHAAPYAVVRWTNIFDPARNIFRGDIISGPLAPVFGPGIVDIDLREVRGQSQGFAHTKYWDLENSAKTVPPHIIELRKALNLAGQCREV